MIPPIPTNIRYPETERLLKEAAKRKMSPEEKREQMVSFAMGMLPMDSKMTKEEVRELMNKRFEELYGNL